MISSATVDLEARQLSMVIPETLTRTCPDHYLNESDAVPKETENAFRL
jgi:hypothetical protein